MNPYVLLIPILIVLLSLCLAAGFDILFLFLARLNFFRLSVRGATVLFFASMTLGLIAVPIGLSFDARHANHPYSPALGVSSMFLYLAGGIIYLQCKSLFSRGYSIRVLVDLTVKGGEDSVQNLKRTYGGGKGLAGLIMKRVESLTKLRLIGRNGNLLGPLTPLGRLFALGGLLYRRFIRLENVG